jgi:hypothetical protein
MPTHATPTETASIPGTPPRSHGHFSKTLTVAYERLLGSAGSSVALHDLAGACVVLADVIDSDSPPLWNDASGRSQSDVVLALTEAASRHVPAPPQVPMNWCMSRWWRNEGSLRCIAS